MAFRRSSLVVLLMVMASCGAPSPGAAIDAGLSEPSPAREGPVPGGEGLTPAVDGGAGIDGISLRADGSAPAPGACTLRGDPGFSAGGLTGAQKLWYDRLRSAIKSASPDPDVTKEAAKNCTYAYGRPLNTYITTLLHVFRVTHDLALLDEIDRLLQIMRGQLADWSITSLGETTYRKDGFQNWLYTHDQAYIGTDVHQMDEMLTHSMVAAVTWAFAVNADLDPRYQERATFWTDYLKNHFEAKWRKRLNKPSGPFLEKRLTHAYTQFIRYHVYMHRLTKEGWYLTAAADQAAIIDKQLVRIDKPSYQAFVWDHAVSLLSGHSLLCQRTNYARYTIQAAQDLALEGVGVFAKAGTLSRFAATLAEQVMIYGATKFAPDVCGGVALGGLAPSGDDPATTSLFAISPLTAPGVWDASGKVGQIAAQVYQARESAPDAPRSIYIPAGLFLIAAKASCGL